MKDSLVKSLWQQKKPVINGWLSIANPLNAEIIASQGYDSMTVDMQHGMVDFASALSMLQSMQATGVTPMVRVPWLDPASVMRALDAGAHGIICPMVNTVEQAQQLVSYMRYPPMGIRSSGPTRAAISEGDDYTTVANDAVFCLAMIETAEALDNVEAIAATEGLDGLYIGPSDLSVSVSQGQFPHGLDRQEPKIMEAIARILAAAQANNIHACIHCGSPEYAVDRVSQGFNLVTLENDVRLLKAAAAKSVSTVRALL